MTAVFVVLLTVNLLKGGGAFDSPVGIVCGSFSFWATSVLSFVYLVGVSLYVRRYLVNRWVLKAEVGFEYVEGDVEWTPLNTIRYPCICFFAGFFAGMFGVGGGIVKGPLMLEMVRRVGEEELPRQEALQAPAEEACRGDHGHTGGGDT
ncbi:conserved unknown protein [Ectocarpus siliculosus]|uniref:Uncharacterized protein n=1 Tax=Ectocarpus siliculosus TaxID=2880 RepID=D8LFQ5_ECTSI|nr:conserved unknown protein [Ectocarpus siliculosus]|eukprot:CBN75629.1 conserved unknown protein [Ectocarpus siliculosus]